MINKCIIVLAVLISYGFKTGDKLMLKIATPFKFNEKNIDPAFVRVVQDATLARAMYSGLLEYDKNGRLVLGVASNYKIDKNQIEFEMAPKVLLENGEYLGIEDVEFTVKRNLIKNTTTHSKLKGFFCNNGEVVEIDKPCAGITLDRNKNKIIFVLDSGAKLDSFVSMLTSHDMRIIPRKSVNKDLEIVDRKLVSGPYKLIKVSASGEDLELAANKKHYRVSEKSAQSVMLKYVDASNLEKSFKNNEIDVIPLFHKMSLDLYEKLSVENNGFKTEGIKNMFLRFTKKGFENFNSNERLVLGNIFKSEYLKLVKPNKLFNVGNTVYPKLSEAYLDESDLIGLNKKISESIMKFKSSKKIKVGVLKTVHVEIQEAFEKNPNFIFQLLEKPIMDLRDMELPDAYIESIDSTFTETSNLLVYALRMGLYGHSEVQANDIINELYNENDSDKKLDKIKKIHRDILYEGRAIPFGHSPYVSISNKKWNLGFSKYFAATNIDEITENDK